MQDEAHYLCMACGEEIVDTIAADVNALRAEHDLVFTSGGVGPTHDDVTVDAGRAIPADAVDPLADHTWVAALEAEPFNPPGVDGVDRGEVRELVRRGTVVERDGVYFAASAVDEAARRLAAALAAQPDGITVAEARDVLGTTRKYALPLLAHLDSVGATRRRGDVRIAGPRLPTAG